MMASSVKTGKSRSESVPPDAKPKFCVKLADLKEELSENEEGDTTTEVGPVIKWPSTNATVGSTLVRDFVQIRKCLSEDEEQSATASDVETASIDVNRSIYTWRSTTLSLSIKSESNVADEKENVPEKVFQKEKRGPSGRHSTFGTHLEQRHCAGHNSFSASTNTSGFVSGPQTMSGHRNTQADPFDIFQDAFMFMLPAGISSEGNSSVNGTNGDSEKKTSQIAKAIKPRWTPPEITPPVLDPNSERFMKFYDGDFYGHILEEEADPNKPGWWMPMMELYRADYKRFLYGNWWQRGKQRMPLLFGKSPKTPAEVVKNLREVLIIVDKWNPPPNSDNRHEDKKYAKALEEVSKNVMAIKGFIFGPDTAEPSSEHIVQVAQLAQEVYNANVLPMLVKMLPKFEFECKKDVASIFNNLLRRQIGTRSPTVEYLGARPEILIQLVQGYSRVDIALQCGQMLRESIRHDHLAKIILYSDVFYTFFHYVQSEVFDIASDAFSTFKDLTTRHKAICAEFLDNNYDVFFGQYQNLLNSKNYVTRRQSLKLLGELLLDRHNFNTMTKYISNPENLKLMMELLRDKSRNIQYEAFHVFKVFVANPNKPRPISDILNRNREKLVEFLGEFHNDRTDDEQFNDEKAYLIKQIQEMKSSPKEPKRHKPKDGDQPVAAEPAIQTPVTEISTAGPSTSGPSTAGPSTSGPSTSGPSTAGPSTSGPSTSGPSTSGPSTSGPSTSGPSTSGPSTSR